MNVRSAGARSLSPLTVALTWTVWPPVSRVEAACRPLGARPDGHHEYAAPSTEHVNVVPDWLPNVKLGPAVTVANCAGVPPLNVVTGWTLIETVAFVAEVFRPSLAL